jgi:acyl-CoA synthetase (AMP-forming)/AMP-acid ligase II
VDTSSAKSVLLNRICENGERPLVRCDGVSIGYRQIVEKMQAWQSQLQALQVRPGQVVSVAGRFSADSIALLLALFESRCIVVPFDDESSEDIAQRQVIAYVEHGFTRHDTQSFGHQTLACRSAHPYLEQLRSAGDAGLILFTSGSTGHSKAALHAWSPLLERYAAQPKRKPARTMVFLKFDHIGGINTLLATVMNGGCIVAVHDRSPEAVCRLIAQEHVDVLPTTPSFLNMLLLSRAWERFDLSSLKLITYGTEPMPASTLHALQRRFPGVKLKQTYGLTELGIFPTRSREDGSTFMQIREGDVQTRIVGEVLHIKCATAMLGYLNAPSPFDADGWYDTGDRVNVEDGFIRVLGRASEMINVGGEKVFPSEIESVLLEMDNVADVAVSGKHSPVTGQLVMATFKLKQPEALNDLRVRVSQYCKDRLEAYKIPRHVVISDAELISSRLKKARVSGPAATGGSER